MVSRILNSITNFMASEKSVKEETPKVTGDKTKDLLESSLISNDAAITKTPNSSTTGIKRPTTPKPKSKPVADRLSPPPLTGSRKPNQKSTKMKPRGTKADPKASENLHKIGSKKDIPAEFQPISTAEDLDKAIVQKLQSIPPSTNIANPKNLKANDDGLHAGTVDLDDDDSYGRIYGEPSSNPFSADWSSVLQEQRLLTELQVSRSRQRLTASGAVPVSRHPKIKDLADELKESTTVNSLLEESANNEQLQLPANEDERPRASIENRSLVYKNRQFSIENSSREALCSDSLRSLRDMDAVSGSSVDPAVAFGTSPSYQRSSFHFSSDTLRGREPHLLRGIRRQTRSKSPSSRGTALAFTPSFTNTLGENLFETTMNDIIEHGGDEFKKKYASWVWDAFRSHLIKMKSLLLVEFNQKMQETLEERELEISELQSQYKEKLAEFDMTTEGFQKMVENLHLENQRVLRAKDALIEKLKKEFIECKKHFEQDLLRQMQSYRKEAEVEKLELQKRNDELMMIMLTDAPKGGLEESFKTEIKSLHKLINTLTAKNEVLHQQLDEVATSSTALDTKTVINLQDELEQTKAEVGDLRRRLAKTEREKEDIIVAHHQEIAKLNKKMQESTTRYDHQLRDAVEEIEELRKRRLKDAKDFKQKLSFQEAHHNQGINKLNYYEYDDHRHRDQAEDPSPTISHLPKGNSAVGGNKKENGVTLQD